MSLSILAILAWTAPLQEEAKAPGSYAVVVSHATWEDPAWREVTEALRDKHAGRVLFWKESPDEVRAPLSEALPRHACFVARPQEAGRDFVVSVHRLTRALDADPYTDVLWGILTGYEASDALRIARCREPLEVRRAAGGCGLDLDAFEEGVWYSEGQKNVMWEKEPGGKPEKKHAPDDTTEAIVRTLAEGKPDLIATSGHATPRDWQIGYSYKNGQFRCRQGQLFGLDLAGRRHDVHSPNPKVYLPSGNCLMGLIEDRETMALAWMRSAGVHQMTGYVVSTWYGYAGWGVNDLFIGQAGRFTLAEAFFLNLQSLVHRLASRFPASAGVELDAWNIETDRKLLQKLAMKHGLRHRDELGLLWDRDTLAFYGDPAWEARVKPLREPAWDQTLKEEPAGRFVFEIRPRREGSWSRPPMALFPRRLPDTALLEGQELQPVLTDTFILVPREGKFEPGETIRVVFRTDRR